MSFSFVPPLSTNFTLGFPVRLEKASSQSCNFFLKAPRGVWQTNMTPSMSSLLHLVVAGLGSFFSLTSLNNHKGIKFIK